MRVVLDILWGFSTGIVIATAFTSFITILGVIPRIAHKFKIEKSYYALGNSVTLGVSIGSMLYLFEPSLTLHPLLVACIGLLFGIFTGCLAVAIAEVLDVMPILNRRMHFKKAIQLFLIAFAIGKMVGAFWYWVLPGMIDFTI